MFHHYGTSGHLEFKDVHLMSYSILDGDSCQIRSFWIAFSFHVGAIRLYHCTCFKKLRFLIDV
jgi:hypothetical protein